MITSSCSEFVLGNEATEDLSPTYASEVRERRGRIQQRVRHSAAEAAVGPARLVVGDAPAPKRVIRISDPASDAGCCFPA